MNQFEIPASFVIAVAYILIYFFPPVMPSASLVPLCPCRASEAVAVIILKHPTAVNMLSYWHSANNVTGLGVASFPFLIDKSHTSNTQVLIQCYMLKLL